jgi:hypothetical protein
MWINMMPLLDLYIASIDMSIFINSYAQIVYVTIT